MQLNIIHINRGRENDRERTSTNEAQICNSAHCSGRLPLTQEAITQVYHQTEHYHEV